MNKMILILITLLFSNQALSGTWFPFGKVGAKTYFTKKKTCEQKEGQECFDITGKDLSSLKLEETSIDDLKSPILRPRYKVTSCDDTASCGQAFDFLNLAEGNHSSYCDENSGDYVTYSENSLMPGWSMYCTGVQGYPQITIKKLVEDPTLKAQSDALKAAKNLKEQALKKITENMAFGEKLKKEIILINISRGLTSNQLQSFLDSFESIYRLLGAGAIDTSKIAISNLTPDGALLREEDKVKILALINEYLNN